MVQEEHMLVFEIKELCGVLNWSLGLTQTHTYQSVVGQ